MGDDTERVLELVDRYARAQAALEHQDAIHRDRQVQYVQHLLEQANALHTMFSADPQRWAALQDTAAAAALESMKKSYEVLSRMDIKAHGVTWEANL